MSRDFTPAPTTVPLYGQIAVQRREIERLECALENAQNEATRWELAYHRAKDELATAAILLDEYRRAIRQVSA